MFCYSHCWTTPKNGQMFDCCFFFSFSFWKKNSISLFSAHTNLFGRHHPTNPHTHANGHVQQQKGVRFDPDIPQTIRLEFAKSNTKVSKPKQQNSSPPAAAPHPTLLHPLTGREYHDDFSRFFFRLSRLLIWSKTMSLNFTNHFCVCVCVICKTWRGSCVTADELGWTITFNWNFDTFFLKRNHFKFIAIFRVFERCFWICFWTMILLSTSQSVFIAMCQPSPVGQVFCVRERGQPLHFITGWWRWEETRRRPIRKKPSVKTWKNKKIEASPAVKTRSVPSSSSFPTF